MYEYNYEFEYYPDELYHHGIKGQKWGVRRFQNANGSLTTAGKKRMRLSERSRAKKEEKRQRLMDDKDRVLRKANAKDILTIQDELTIKELREATERARLKNELSNMQKGKSKAERIIKNAKNVRKATIAVFATTATVYKYRKQIQALLNGDYLDSLRN